MARLPLADAGIPARSPSLSRRRFLRIAAATGFSMAGAVLLGGCASAPAVTGSTGETLETTTIKLPKIPAICVAAQYVAEEFLQREGFTSIQYINLGMGRGINSDLGSGQVDISIEFVGPFSIDIDIGSPVVVLAGVHVGCFELFGNQGVRSISDLKGKSVGGILRLGGSQHVFLSSMMAYVGLDPRTDVNWVTLPAAEAIPLFAEGKIDAYMGFPPTPQELRAKKIGHVVVNSMMDKPWSQYFCCVVAGNKEFVRQNPVATKRALHAILQAADLCAREPEKVARYIVDKGFTPNYDYALETLKHLPYDKWQAYDPEDTLRFYSLRLRDAGMLKSSPDEIIARGTDWRFLNELKQEMSTPKTSSNGFLCTLG